MAGLRVPVRAVEAIYCVWKQLFTYFDFDEVDDVVKQVQQESEGTHADEIETSMMLYIAPNTVRMSKAVKDLHPHHRGGLTRDPTQQKKPTRRQVHGVIRHWQREKKDGSW